MDLMGMMGKLRDAQTKIEATKQRLDTVIINQESSDGLLSISLTANLKIKTIDIAPTLLEDKEQLEDYLIVVFNKAIEKATEINKTEIDAVTKIEMPVLPGMEDFFK